MNSHQRRKKRRAQWGPAKIKPQFWSSGNTVMAGEFVDSDGVAFGPGYKLVPDGDTWKVERN